MEIRILSFALLSFLIFSPIVFAQGKTYQYCDDNTTLIKKTEITVDVPQRNITRTFNVTDPILCENGCNMRENKCYGDSWIGWIIALGVIIASLLIFGVIRGMTGE